VLLGSVASAALAPEQFAVGWPLELPGGAEFYDLPLTLDVYRQAPNSEQLAVLDALGEPMSFYIVTPPAPSASERRVTLAASPLYAIADGDAIAEVSVATENRRANLTVTQPAAAADIVAFVIDARAMTLAPFAIDLDWRALPQPFLMEVRVEQSQSLTGWRNVGRASIAALSIDGAEARHARVPIAAEPGGYYRVTASSGVPDWYLQSATLIGSEASRLTPLTVVLAELDPSAGPATDQEAAAEMLYFDAGGTLPVSAATLEFSGDNGWLRADVATSASLEGPWSIVASRALFYELDFEGERLTSPPLELGRREARYFRFRVDKRPPRPVALELAYPQEHLRFAAEGTPPYELTAGTLAADAGPDRTFASLWATLRPTGATLPLAVLGARRELGGAAALVAPSELPWRTASLWAVLVAGVLVVAWMAVRLVREVVTRS
jgi:hypothetical protein